MPRPTSTPLLAAGISLLCASTLAGAAGHVTVTALGSHDGEFCRADRALVFEDPNGTRVLYDAGRTVAGAADPRLGKIDIVLVSHMHGDHLGDKRIETTGKGSCAAPETPVDATPNSNSVEIAVASKAKLVTGSEMPRFLATKMQAAGGDPKDSVLVRFGASQVVGGVAITTVPAAHSNGVAPEFVGGKLAELLEASGLTAYVGPPTGYVLTFSNGLIVYLSGDTGITAEQDSVVRGHYAAELAVMNIGDTYTTGPTEAAYVVNQLIKPTSIIASHANEAATQDGKVVAGSRTARFIEASQMPVHIPLSGTTMAFDGGGQCVTGC
ncbi:MBL fold metallo-hydrolase [Thiosocius teredinicola]|uniref:MBL fold metallo-hydrolase n=1 Tax=Thiosocius teredinicola TaxID=1973002 RepID=UPI0009912BD1